MTSPQSVLESGGPAARKLEQEIVLYMANRHVRQVTPLYIFAFGVTLLFGLAVVVTGCVLVYVGATKDADISIFGMQVSTVGAGIVAIVVGIYLSVTFAGRWLTDLEALWALPSDWEEDRTSESHGFDADR